MPTSDSGSEHGLTDSGAALNDGLLTDSADGQYLLATGYDDPLGTASVTSSSVSRTVAIVSSAGAVDTTTSATGTTVTGNNFRSAICGHVRRKCLARKRRRDGGHVGRDCRHADVP